ncbi:DUF2147 domain-containing protein [Methylocapsa aurea]|uniref:DUF2147 domain-containing protein n=1 Tax=Methylocapsa aurea TaxID=663610 RepID=UPI000563334C|nr:DUF2147 domain-containing protein [Methylocapsa aurea]
MKPQVILTVLALVILSVSQAGADPIGEWRVQDGNATVRIRKCGAAFCGFIASTRTAPGKDEKNPDPSKRTRSVLGIEVLIGLRPAGNNLWSGQTYNAEDGQMYNASVSMASDQALQIQGCVPNSGLCGNETWTRVR